MTNANQPKNTTPKPKTKKPLSSVQMTRKNKIVLTIIVGGLVFLLMLLALYVSDPNKGKSSALDEARDKAGYRETDFTVSPGDTIDSEVAWRETSQQEIEDSKLQTQQMQTEIEKLRQELEQMRNEPDSITVSNSTLPPQPVAPPPPPQPVAPPPQPVAPPPMQQLPPPPQASNDLADEAERLNASNDGESQEAKKRQIKHISLSENQSSNDETQQSGEKKISSKNVNSYVPSGAFSKVVLLSGVDAPTGGLASSNPVPVLLRIKDKGTLANYFKTDLKECTAIGAAAGDISSERVNIRLESITCVLINGRIIEKPIKGYVAGEDGKAGFRGRLVSKQGALIARSAMAGLAGGIGSSVKDQYQNVATSALGQVTSVKPGKAFESGMAEGFGNAMEKIADFYIQRANETYPIIEIASARVGDIVLTEGVDFGVSHIGKKRKG